MLVQETVKKGDNFIAGVVALPNKERIFITVNNSEDPTDGDYELFKSIIDKLMGTYKRTLAYSEGGLFSLGRMGEDLQLSAEKAKQFEDHRMAVVMTGTPSISSKMANVQLSSTQKGAMENEGGALPRPFPDLNEDLLRHLNVDVKMLSLIKTFVTMLKHRLTY